MPGRKPTVPGAALLLFGLTVLSTTYVGALRQLGAQGQEASAAAALRHLPLGLSFSLPLCAILVCHELGHYLLCLRHRASASLPYFIPFPLSAIGTLGAIIGLREEVRDRDALFDIAAAGPLVGLLCALPILCVGLSLSKVGPVPPGSFLEGQSLLYLALKYAIKGQWLPHMAGGQLVDVDLHPMAYAGWVGLFLTMINLLPIGQLDGGRLATAVLGAGEARLSRLFHRGLVLMALGSGAYVALGSGAAAGLEVALGWLVGAGVLWLLRRLVGSAWHPEVDEAPLSPGRRRLAWGIAVLWGLLLMPYFMRRAA